LKKVLVEKYRIKEDEAQAFADFLLPMLEWNHEARASAEEMLKHPWLDMPANYEFKYTERGYEVMMMKKELKNQTKGGAANQDDAGQEELQEMNELVDSDPELYGADTEDVVKPVKRAKKSAKDDLKLEIKNYLIDLNNTDVKIGGAGDKDGGILSGNKAADEKIFKDLFDPSEISLEDPEESRAK